MKKFTLAAMALVAGAFAVQAADGDTFDISPLSYTVLSEEDGTVAVSGNIGSLTELTVPMTVENDGKTYFVTAIADRGLYGLTTMKSLTLPESIMTIGQYGVYNCKALTSISLPNSVTSVGNQAFRTCNAMEKIKLSSGCNNYGTYAFANAIEVTDLTIPACVDGAVTVGNYAFSGMQELNNLYLPGEYAKIGSSGVAGYGALQVYLYSQIPFATGFNPANKTTAHVSSEAFAENWLENGGTGWANCRWVYDLDSNPWTYVKEITLPASLTATVGITTPIAIETRAAADDIVWRSSNIGVAFVDQHGNVYPRKEGKATITAMACSSSNEVVKAECEVTVTSNNQDGVVTIAAEKDARIFNIQGVEMNPDATLPAGIYVKAGKKIIVK